MYFDVHQAQVLVEIYGCAISDLPEMTDTPARFLDRTGSFEPFRFAMIVG